MEHTPLIPQRLFGDYTGQLSPAYAQEEFIARLGEAFYPERMQLVRDGRNQLFRLDLQWRGVPLPLAVKRFGSDHPVKTLSARWKGSKAFRSWRAALALFDRDVGTPEPIGFLEVDDQREGPSCFYLCRYVEDTVSFRDELVRLFHQRPLCRLFMDLLQTVASGVRGLHAAGVQHNDLGNQNILLRRTGEGTWVQPLFIDLNRARVKESLSLEERARDVSRLYLPSDLRRVFLEMLFAPETVPEAFQMAEARHRRRFDRHTRTRRWRHPIREARLAREPRDPADDYPPEREMWIWDDRSEQPIPALRSRDRHRHYSLRNHLRVAVSAARHYPGLRLAAARLEAQAFQNPVEFTGRIGVAVSATPATLERERALLRELGRPPLLARFYHHETEREWEHTVQALREWHAEGHALMVSLCQDRRAVRQPGRWNYFVNYVLRHTADLAEDIEIGHAINRVKWGLWDLREYAILLREVAEVVADYPQARLAGPAVIDFEWHQLAAALDAVPDTLTFAALSHHLYVDRRGAPENPQAGRDLVGKLAVLRAFATRHPRCGGRVVVSEVNWPLLGTGVWSPVGSPYASPGPRHGDPSVGEDDYAAYLVRYLLLALGSGLADRVYWWKLSARGFGLVDPSDRPWRKRPAFEALANLLRLTEGRRFLRREADPSGAIGLAFSPVPGSAAELQVWWRNGPAAPFVMPGPVSAALDLVGAPIALAGETLPLGPAPVFLQREPGA
jgi:hypothetical protein